MEAATGRSRWWSKELPPIVDSVLYGAYFGLTFGFFLLLTLAPITMSAWLLYAASGTALLAVGVYVWFFHPVYPLSDSDIPLPESGAQSVLRATRRARRCARGEYLGTLSLAATWAGTVTATAVSSSIRGDGRLLEWLALFATLVGFAVFGMWFRPSILVAAPLWARRLGKTGIAVDRREPSDRRFSGRFAGALLGAAVFLVLVLPVTVFSAMNAREYVANHGRERWIDGGGTATLVTGATFTTPSGWTTLLATDNPVELEYGRRQNASTGPESGSDAGFVHISVYVEGEARVLGDPEAIARAARKDSLEVFGPEEFDYMGWRGICAVTEDSIARQMGRLAEYNVWVQVTDSDDRTMFMSADMRVLGEADPSEPARLASFLIDLLDLRPSAQ